MRPPLCFFLPICAPHPPTPANAPSPVHTAHSEKEAKKAAKKAEKESKKLEKELKKQEREAALAAKAAADEAKVWVWLPHRSQPLTTQPLLFPHLHPIEPHLHSPAAALASCPSSSRRRARARRFSAWLTSTPALTARAC